MQLLTSYSDALTLAEALRQEVDDRALLFGTLFLVRDREKRSFLAEILADSAALRAMDMPLSDRLVRRYLISVQKHSRRSGGFSPKRFRTPIMNTIGAYALLCMGIVEPSLFVTRRGEIDEETREHLRSILAEDGLDLEKLAKRYALTASGPFFWQRWAVIGERPTAVTDRHIRYFITDVVRYDEKTIFACEAVTQLLDELEDSPDEIEATEVLQEMLENQAFQGMVAKLIVGPWRQYFRDFKVKIHEPQRFHTMMIVPD